MVANGKIRLFTTEARDKFASSLIAIVNEYGFDGIDIDFEGNSLALEDGDGDFKNPTSPLIVNTIAAIRTTLDSFGSDFILTMAPETFFVQLGYQFYGGLNSAVDSRAGAYLPVIYGLLDRLTFLQVQYYNSGSITALDDQFYAMGDPDFYVALVDMLLRGFPVNKNPNFLFPALRPDQILIGVPATVNAGGGFTGAQGVITAMDYLINGRSFNGKYQLNQTYPDLRGVMSWSINWDDFEGETFSTEVRNYLDGLGQKTAASTLESGTNSVYPNPFSNTVNLSFTLAQRTKISAIVYNQLGAKVYEVKESAPREAGKQTLSWNSEGAAPGIYYLQLQVNEDQKIFKLLKN